jgi:hypothetical protein
MEEASNVDVETFLQEGWRAEEDAATVAVEDGWLEDAGNFFMYPLRILMAGGDKKNAQAPVGDAASPRPQEGGFGGTFFGFGSKKPVAEPMPTEVRLVCCVHYQAPLHMFHSFLRVELLAPEYR